MFKIGLAMLGSVSLIFIVVGILMRVYTTELTQWGSEPPAWMWLIVGILFVVAVVGGIIAYLADD